MGYDPEGTWNWKKFLITALVTVVVAAVVIAVTVATAGTAVAAASTILAATAIKTTAAVVVAATVTTATTLTTAAGLEKVVALDLSYSKPSGAGTNAKGGGTLVFDFKNDNIELYTHGGISIGKASGPSYSVGIVENYDGERGYEGWFDFFGGSINKGYGFDYCYSSGMTHDIATKAYSVTFGTGSSAYFGRDYYYYVGNLKIKW